MKLLRSSSENFQKTFYTVLTPFFPVVKRLLNIIGLPQIFHWALTMLCHQNIPKQSRVLWPLGNSCKFFLVSVFSLELFIYRRTSRDFVLGPDSNAHDEREERGYFSISGFWFKSDYSEKWLMMTLSVSTIKPIPLWASFFPGKESGGKKKKYQKQARNLAGVPGRILKQK